MAEALPEAAAAEGDGVAAQPEPPRSGIVRHVGRDRDTQRPHLAAHDAVAPQPPRAAAGLPRRRSTAGDPLVGSTEQGLHIERLIAEGGMGAVYAAHLVATGEPVALKVLRTVHAGDPGAASRFAREVRLARRIDHPNVCPVLGEGLLEDGRPFFLMPLYEGVTLGEEVRRNGPLPLRRALALADQILAGLAAMHVAKVVHLDLQPGNILLVGGGPGGGAGEATPTVKLIDLGFAHEPGADTGDGVTPDSPGSLVGTLLFMSPEQAMRSRAITERSDLFAAALLLYYALSGKLPFRGRGDLDVLVAIVRSAPVPLRRERRDVPRVLDDVLSRALSKHPDHRFPGAAAMRAALAAVPA
ncbi:protein kinase [Sorangium cellulosum]|uniref:Protein kinase n=1 Tax=Sorangium cellulosum TaxID=56 RepID=A0A2L0EWT8_SORCE|nr:serine/threonine-protein kinase [Sorangium cellulosum]AUX43767.1 protein kinase [Sorangium cellulosum]